MSNFQQIQTTKITKTTSSNDNPNMDMEQNPPSNENEDFNKYFQQTSQTTSEPIDFNGFRLEQNPSSMSHFQQTTTTTTTKTTGNGPNELKEFGMEQNQNQEQNGNNEVDFKQFRIEQNESQVPGNEDFY